MRGTPHLDEITSEERQAVVKLLPGSVLINYMEGDQLERFSKAIYVQTKFDPTRLRRRLDSKLDFLMGKYRKN